MPGLAAEPTAVEFEASLEKCRVLMGRSRWKAARLLLDETLEAHKGKAYVRIRLTEIVEDMTRCAFGLAHPAPDPKNLVSGELKSYRPGTGEIKLRYTPGKLQDFVGGDGKRPKRGEVHLHPAVFSGPYSLEIRGKDYGGNARYTSSSRVPLLLAGVDGDYAFQVTLGYPKITVGNQVKWLPSRIIYIKGDDSKIVAEKESSPAKLGKSYAVKVSVGKSDVGAYYNRRRILFSGKPKSLYGRAGFIGLGEFTEITIQGKIAPAWIQGLLDEAMQATRKKFRETYRVDQDLPRWLLEKPEPTISAGETDSRPAYPGDLKVQRSHSFVRARSFLDQQECRQGIEYVNGLEDGDLPEDVRNFFLALFHMELENNRDALIYCERVCQLNPSFLEARLRRAALFSALGKREESIVEYRAILPEAIDDPGVHAALATQLLLHGRPEEAKEIVDGALLRSLVSSHLEGLNQLLVKALRGPNWTKVHRYDSRNYRIFSDIDRQTCIEASKILEESYRGYTIHLQAVRGLEKRKFTVYLFSGEAGYSAHAEGTMGSVPVHSAGLYSPMLKQLLIWNLPDRDSMMRTVRHEAFHQYLDQLVEDAPRWFNEGLAEYYELARIERGEWAEGQVDMRRVESLRPFSSKLVPLKRFLDYGPREFYANASINYAQGWAFIHFLRHGGRKSEGIFEHLFEKLMEGMSGKEAMDSAFGGHDLDVVQQEFVRYLDGLR